MTNAVFGTEPLPLKTDITSKTGFESALMDYFSIYSPSRTGELVSRLKRHDFSSVKAHFIASVPGKFEGESANKWGLGRLKKLLHSIKSHPRTELFGQVPSNFHSSFSLKFSSIGSFGKNDTWLGPQFHQTLATSNTSHPLPQLRLIYPTLKNVQESLNGYRSGTSIHWTISSPAHEAQERYMRPLLRQWHSLKAGRERAAPHIKTYGRLTPDNTFDWFMMTSANLSKAAWGAQEGKPPDTGLRIRSFEVGVLLDPALYGEGTVFVPTYKSDFPSEEQISWAKERGYKTVVAIRMAWDIPFQRYEGSDVPWVKNRSYSGVDWLGRTWD